MYIGGGLSGAVKVVEVVFKGPTADNFLPTFTAKKFPDHRTHFLLPSIFSMDLS